MYIRNKQNELVKLFQNVKEIEFVVSESVVRSGEKGIQHAYFIINMYSQMIYAETVEISVRRNLSGTRGFFSTDHNAQFFILSHLTSFFSFKF